MALTKRQQRALDKGTKCIYRNSSDDGKCTYKWSGTCRLHLSRHGNDDNAAHQALEDALSRIGLGQLTVPPGIVR